MPSLTVAEIGPVVQEEIIFTDLETELELMGIQVRILYVLIPRSLYWNASRLGLSIGPQNRDTVSQQRWLVKDSAYNFAALQ